MNSNFVRKGIFTLIASTGLVGAAVVAPGGAHAASIAFSTQVVGEYGGEPSITSDTNGVLYVSTPSGVTNPKVAGATEPGTWRSFDKGTTWAQIESPDPSSGDTCLNTDSQNSLYWCNLNGSVGVLPLQADVWKSNNASTPACTTNPGTPPGSPNTCNWVHGDPATIGTSNLGASSCIPPNQPPYPTSCNFFGVDRQWVASYIAAGNNTSQAEVVLMYHDFYGPSHIWVNVSTNGGTTFGPPKEILSSPAFTQNAATGAITAEGYTFCNTVPLNDGIAPPGTAHAGRMFVSWIASDPIFDGAGCNLSQNEPFHTAWVAYSDDGGNTWTPQMAFDAGIGRDLSTPFASFTLDNQGNPYIAFNTEPPATQDAAGNATQTVQPLTCEAETDQQLATGTGNLQTDKGCSYNTYVVWSQDGGSTWDGGGGGRGNPLLNKSAAAPYLVNDASRTLGTSLYATIAAGDPGQVDVSYLYTTQNEPQGDAALGKFDPAGCAGSLPNTTRCKWNLIGAQSLNLTQPPATASFTNVAITTTPMHYGDICNLGIACPPITPDGRHLLDFNQETIDPTTGCAHISYADDNEGNTYGIPGNNSPNGKHVVVANQTLGCLTLTPPPSTNVPEAPLASLLVGGGVAALITGAWFARRRRGASVA